MNAPDKITLHDVQSQPDSRNICIDAVGIKGMRYPVTIQAGERLVPTIATLSMTVGLAAIAKGTHMSRFIELLEAHSGTLDMLRFKGIVLDMLDRLQAHSGAIEMRFPYFVKKTAPISGVQSQLDYDICWQGRVSDKGKYSLWMHVMVPATSLCPCSKAISDYGAHNQRSCISIKAEITDEMQIEELIGIAERSASCEVYGLLKRPDEKYVTERAYDNPKFVEDLVRDVALSLNQDPRVGTYVVEAENFESIHNHSAFAQITRPSSTDRPIQRKERQGQNLQLLVSRGLA
ncbi:MAG: GTP cyclohydrolase FolE2 [Pyrinomonadaceae bacterium]